MRDLLKNLVVDCRYCKDAFNGCAWMLVDDGDILSDVQVESVLVTLVDLHRQH